MGTNSTKRGKSEQDRVSHRGIRGRYACPYRLLFGSGDLDAASCVDRAAGVAFRTDPSAGAMMPLRSLYEGAGMLQR